MQLAWPEAFKGSVELPVEQAAGRPLTVKLTWPVGVPAPPDTVAVRNMALPATAGLTLAPATRVAMAVPRTFKVWWSWLEP